MRKALALLTLSTFSGAGLSFFTQVFLARNLPVAEFGAFTAALSLVALIAPVGGFGISAFLLKIFGQEGWGGIRWMGPSLKFTFLSCMLGVTAIYGWTFFTSDVLSRKILWILGVSVIAQPFLENVSAVLQLEEKYLKMAVWQFFPHAIRFLFVFVLWAVLKERLSVDVVSLVYFLVAMVIAVMGGVIMVQACDGKIVLKGHGRNNQSCSSHGLPSVFSVFKQVWPFGFAGIFHLIYFQSQILIVQSMLGNESAGQYGVAITIMTAVYLLPGIIYQKFFLAKIHIWANHDRKKLKLLYQRGNFVMLLSGTIISLLLLSLSSVVVPFLFGENFSASVSIVAVMALAIPFRFVASSVGAMLMTGNNIRTKVYCMGLVAVLNIGMGFLLTAEYGLMGAVYATILTEVFLLILYFISVKINFSELMG